MNTKTFFKIINDFLKTIFYFIFLITVLLTGCGKSELEIQKEAIRKGSDELKMAIDSTQLKVDSAWKNLDSLRYIIKRDSVEIDSLMKKINPLKKFK